MAQWSRRFSEQLDEAVAAFNASVSFDKKLAFYDIAGSIAHAKMLAKQQIITADDAADIIRGLEQIKQEIADDTFTWRIEDEDVHMAIEKRLIAIIGDTGKKLHTARSRNDQVATDIRLFLREQIDILLEELVACRQALLKRAEEHLGALMPAMTHLQIAQPVLLSHHLMAYDAMFARDIERLVECRARVNHLPLGAGALTGTSFPIDREYTAGLLEFGAVCANSLDAVSDRDFLIEFASDAAILMMHLSRFSEEIILWMSAPFDWVRLPDALCTGSSVMPQKKNPDIPELIRGKTGRVYGALMSLLALMKGQPLAYNKDNQEDKEAIFDCVDTSIMCVGMSRLIIENMMPQTDNMRRALDRGYAVATELADYLTKQGMPFRQAHDVVSAIVRFAEENQLSLNELSLSQLRQFNPDIDERALAALDPHQAVASRDHIGGTAEDRVRQAIARARAQIEQYPFAAS